MAFTFAFENFTADQGAYFPLTATQISITDGAAEDYYTLVTPPAGGNLLKDRAVLAAGDTFTPADVAAGIVVYDHAGVGTTADAIGISAFNSVAGTTTVTDTNAITVSANSGWMPVCRPAGAGLFIPGNFARQGQAIDFAAKWLIHNIGTASAIKVTTTNTVAIGALVPKGVEFPGAFWQNYSAAEMKEIEDMAKQLVLILGNETAYEDLSTAIAANAELTDMIGKGLTSEQVKLLQALNERVMRMNLKHNRNIVNPWHAVLYRADVLIG